MSNADEISSDYFLLAFITNANVRYFSVPVFSNWDIEITGSLVTSSRKREVIKVDWRLLEEIWKICDSIKVASFAVKLHSLTNNAWLHVFYQNHCYSCCLLHIIWLQKGKCIFNNQITAFIESRRYQKNRFFFKLKQSTTLKD